MTIASLWKTSSIHPSQRWQSHQVSVLVGLVGCNVVHWSTASQSQVMDKNGTAQAGGEGVVLPLHLSAAAVCVSERRNRSREV